MIPFSPIQDNPAHIKYTNRLSSGQCATRTSYPPPLYIDTQSTGRQKWETTSIGRLLLLLLLLLQSTKIIPRRRRRRRRSRVFPARCTHVMTQHSGGESGSTARLNDGKFLFPFLFLVGQNPPFPRSKKKTTHIYTHPIL